MKSDFDHTAARLNRHALRFGLGFALLAGASGRVMSAEAPQSFDQFKIVLERNIFSSNPSRQATGPEKAPQPIPERLILFGTCLLYTSPSPRD